MEMGVRIGAWAKNGGSPSIRPVEFLESFSSGGQYIVLNGLYVSSAIKFEIEYKTYSISTRLFGGQSSRSVALGFDGNYSSSNCRLIYGGAIYQLQENSDVFNTASFDGQVLMVNESKTAVTAKSFSTSVEPCLFGYNSIGIVTTNSHSAVKMLDVEDGSTRLSLRPYVDENGNPFMLNILGGGGVNGDGRFYNSGVGEFGWKELDGTYVPPRGS